MTSHSLNSPSLRIRSVEYGRPPGNAPVFSIVLPTWNRPKMLQRAVSSVRRQTFRDFELIVVDDGSSGPCGVTLSRDSRIRIIRNASRLGVAQARNVGIEAARGAYISFLDDDDEYLASFLSSTYASLKNTPEGIGISWCGVKFIDYPSKANEALKLRIKEFAPHKRRPTILEVFLSIGTGWGVTIKAACLRKVGPFDNALKVCSDTDMFLRILGKGFTPLAVPGVHVVVHNHHGSRLTSAAMYQEELRTHEWLLRQHSEFLDAHPILRNNFLSYTDHLRKKLGNAGSHQQASPVRATRDYKVLSRFLMIRDWFARAR